MTTVRKQKSGDQLAVGDWVAPGELLDGAAEVLYALPYPAAADRSRDNDGKHVHIVVRGQGATVPESDIVGGNALFDLASEADLALLREQAERQMLADELRGLALLILDPAMPVPQFGITVYGSFKTHAEVRAAAEVFSLPVESREPNKGIQTPEWPLGRASYEPGVHLHWLTIVEEPERCETCGESLREIERGTLGHIPGEACAPTGPAADPYAGVPMSELPEYRDDDPTGLAYTRADDDTADPTPPGPREPLHTGAMTERGLVDETPAEPHPTWPTEAELKPWETLAPPAGRLAESMEPIDPDSSMEAHYDAETEAMTGLGITDACVITGWAGLCTTHKARHIASGEAKCGCPVYPYAGRGDAADTIVDHRQNCKATS